MIIFPQKIGFHNNFRMKNDISVAPPFYFFHFSYRIRILYLWRKQVFILSHISWTPPPFIFSFFTENIKLHPDTALQGIWLYIHIQKGLNQTLLKVSFVSMTLNIKEGGVTIRKEGQRNNIRICGGQRGGLEMIYMI